MSIRSRKGRRLYCQIGSCPRPLSISLALLIGVSSAQASEDSPLAALVSGHPRVLLRSGGVDDLRQRMRTDETLQRWSDALRRDARQILEAEPCRYEIPDGLRLLSVSRKVLQRVRTLALVSLLDDNVECRDRCWRELQAAAEFPDWNPRHFLDTAEMTHAFALGLDWLFDDWTGEQRDVIRRAIVQHGLVPGRECYRGQASYGWWVGSRHNWNQVCNAGLTMGALAVADDEPELADQIVRGALQSIRRAMEEFRQTAAIGKGQAIGLTEWAITST